jgi:hypothetical protein
MYQPILGEFWSETIRQVERRRKQDAEAQAKLEGKPIPNPQSLQDLEPTNGEECLSILAELIAQKQLSNGSRHVEGMQFFEALGVDLKQVEAEAQAKLDGKAPPKAAEVRAPAPSIAPKVAEEPLPKTPPTLVNGRPKQPAASLSGNPTAEKVIACLRRKGFNVGTVPKEEAAIEARLDTKLVFVKAFPAVTAGKLAPIGYSTVRELLEQSANAVDPIADSRFTLMGAGIDEPSIKRCVEALSEFFGRAKKVCA